MKAFYILDCGTYFSVRRTADNQELFLSVDRASAEWSLAKYLGGVR